MNNSTREEYLFRLNKGDIKECLTYIKNEKYTLFQLTDSLGFTILHKASSLNLYEDCIDIIDILMNNLTKYEFISYINQKNKAGFTALHYACYNGNIKLIKILVNNGADIDIVNNNGLNLLHIASQGNQTTPLYYFIHKYKLNINSIDKLGNTCLHWASFYNNDKVLNFLLLCDKIKVNIQNKNGFTPLHFCVLGTNIKAIKKLITVGGDISIKNNLNETCINLAEKKNYKEIKNVIIKKYYIMKFNSYTIIFFYLFHIIMPILMLIFIMKELYDNYYIIIYLIWNSILFLVLYYFNKITTKSFLRLKDNNKSDNLLKLIENKNIDISNYCPKCNIIIHNENRIKHCYICDCCIEDFDHHCIWIGKCLGKDNKNIFLLLLVLIELNIIINTIICIINEPLFSNKYKTLYQELNNKNIFHILFIINLITLILCSIIIIPLIKSKFKKLLKYNAIYSFNENEKNINKNDIINKESQRKYYHEPLLNIK